MRAMDRTRAIVFASAVAAAMFLGGLLGATALAHSSLASATSVFAASSPSPSPRSNEDSAHEKNETPSQEAAENNGTAMHGPGGPNGHPCGGHSNEDAAHEKAETAAQEAAENAPCPSPPASSSTNR